MRNCTRRFGGLRLSLPETPGWWEECPLRQKKSTGTTVAALVIFGTAQSMVWLFKIYAYVHL
jgi:hypothetical protein